jgi:tetratricopeptide (TPR) repeat protein
LAAGITWVIWHLLGSYQAPTKEVVLIEPPTLELAGVDPAIVKAIQTAQTACAQTPRSALAWGQLGKTLLAHEFYVAGGKCLAQAEQLDPTQARWPYLQGIAFAAADPPDPGAAIQKLEHAVELGKEVPDALRLRLGEVLLAQDRLDEAERQFQRVLQVNPTHARGHLGLARLALRRGNPAKCREHLDHALNDPHAKKAARLLLTEVQQRLGKEPAAEEIRQVAQLPEDPAWPDPFWEDVLRLRTGLKAHLYRAERWLRQGRSVEALALLQQCVQDYPDAYYAWLVLGRAYIRQRNDRAAEQALRTALKLAPDSAEVHFHLGIALFHQGHYRAAEEAFRSATQAKPNFAMAHYNVGYCLVHKGDRAGAIEAFRLALRYQPDYADAHMMLSRLLANNGQHAEALAHAQLAVQYSPADSPAKKRLQPLPIQFPILIGP